MDTERTTRIGAWLVKSICGALLAAACVAHGAQPAEPAGSFLEYRVQAGDSLYTISREHFVPGRGWRDVQQLNGIREPRRLRPGSVVRIPLAWLRTAPAQAEILFHQGNVRIERAGTPIAVERGAKIVAGDVITTDPGAYLTLRFDDGATVAVQAGSRAEVTVLRTRGLARAIETQVGVERGAVETRVPRRGANDRFEIRTPLAATAVRGTEFRAGFDEQARSARTEVLEGVVAVGTQPEGPSGTRVEAGFGATVDVGGSASVVRLLPAPDLSAVPEVHERTIVRITFPPVPGAARYRVAVRDEQGGRIAHESVVDRAEVRIADLPDGRYRLRARAIDAARLEGLDAERGFVLKARPEPPFPSEPADRGRVRADAAQLRWTGAAEAVRYRLQIADNPGFRSPLVDRADIAATTFTTPPLADGTWYWRLASIRGDGDTGPFSDVSRFERRPPPAEPEPPAVDDTRLNVRWRGEPGQVFRLQLSRDATFGQILHERAGIAEPTASLERPAPGVYYLRVQATDPDGFVGPFTTPQRIEVPEPPPPPTPWWLLILFLLPLL